MRYMQIYTFFYIYLVSCLIVTEPSQEQILSRCGPQKGFVSEIIDGDTIRLDTGEKIRYILVDTPEKGECHYTQATAFNSDFVLGQEIDLIYDVECEDRYDRLLAYVSTSEGEINSILIARGLAKVLYVSPNGKTRHDEFLRLQKFAKQNKEGLWKWCE